MQDFLLPAMIGDPPTIVLDAVNVVFSPSSVDSQVEEFCIGITFLYIRNARTLLFSSPLQDRKGNDSSLQA
jgi:hypothetical protein